MIVLTLLTAVVLVTALYFFVLRFIPWAFVAYGWVFFAGMPFLLAESVYLHYIGFDVIAMGLCIVWCQARYRRWRKVKAPRLMVQWQERYRRWRRPRAYPRPTSDKTP